MRRGTGGLSPQGRTAQAAVPTAAAPGTTEATRSQVAAAPGTTARARAASTAAGALGTTSGSSGQDDPWLRDLARGVRADAPGRAAARRADRAEAWASLRATVLRLAVVAAAAAALLTWVFALVRVEGAGMYPTAGDGDLALVWRLADAEADLVADTVVAYEVDGTVYVGRIVAVAGDEVEVTDEGYLLVNGNVQDAVTLEGTYPSTSGDVEYPLTLAEGELWVLGDGRADAIGTDSRTLGPVAASEVVGTVVALLRLRGI